MEKQTKDILLFGAHASILGGFDKAIERGESIGCTAIQIFTKSNRQWNSKQITTEQIKLFLESFKQSTIKSVITHASYLINIGSSNKELNKKSVDALTDELRRCEELKIPYLVLHPGSRQNSTEKECIDLIATNINTIFNEVPGKCMILLENTAGMGTSVGHTFEQLSQIMNNIDDKHRIGICFDTCHAFAAGYDFNTKETYNNMWSHFDKVLGLKTLKAMHINDSKKECGSKVDRHAHIGKGKIGIEAFSLIFNDQRFFDIPKILETPIIKSNMENYIPDIKVIVNLISQKNMKLIKGLKFQQYLS